VIRGDNYDIEAIEEVSGRRRQVAASPAYDGQFTWSPDGARLAFVSSRDGNDAMYVTTVSNGATTRLTDAPTLDPGWSP
jgi:TolB protein